MYYICKFFDTWTFYDASKSSTRQLDPAEVSSIKALLPGLIDNKNLFALQISAVNPNKLVNLPTGASSGKKAA